MSNLRGDNGDQDDNQGMESTTWDETVSNHRNMANPKKYSESERESQGLSRNFILIRK
jgi:hypothetical protein